MIPRTTSAELMTGVSRIITAPVLTTAILCRFLEPAAARNRQIGGKGVINPCGRIGWSDRSRPDCYVEAAAAEHACLPQSLLLENRTVVSIDGYGEIAAGDLIGGVREQIRHPRSIDHAQLPRGDRHVFRIGGVIEHYCDPVIGVPSSERVDVVGRVNQQSLD